MFLLDTNVISELRKVRFGKADPGVAAWSESVAVSDLFVSAISIQEIEIGILQLARRDAAQGALLRTWMDSHVLPAFADRVLAIDVAVAVRSARLHVPDPRPVRDGLIAGTALVHNLVVVTRNTHDFRSTGVRILNPWEADSSAA